MPAHATRLIAAMCTAKVGNMAGTMVFPGLLPILQVEWALSNTEAGWINGAFFAGYGALVPILVSYTDRIDARKVYLASAALGAVAMFGFAALAEGFWTALIFRVLTGISFAGTYMPGLKLLGERLSGAAQTRAVSFYTATGAAGMAFSVLLSGLAGDTMHWRWAAALTGLGPLLAVPLTALAIGPAARRPGPVGAPVRVWDFRPVLRNRPAMGYMLGYAVHCWELFGYWGWVVAYLAFALSLHGTEAVPFSAQHIAAVALLAGLPASVLGNEGALRLGRRRAVSYYMIGSALVGVVLGFGSGWPMAVVAFLAIVYGATVMSDSASLTAGMVAAARDGEQGRTMALHSFLGFGVAFIAPIAFGAVLDLAGGGPMAWGFAFMVLAVVPLTGPLWLYAFGPRRAAEVIETER